jgi:hypothetical protein
MPGSKKFLQVVHTEAPKNRVCFDDRRLTLSNRSLALTKSSLRHSSTANACQNMVTYVQRVVYAHESKCSTRAHNQGQSNQPGGQQGLSMTSDLAYILIHVQTDLKDKRIFGTTLKTFVVARYSRIVVACKHTTTRNVKFKNFRNKVFRQMLKTCDDAYVAAPP